VRYGLGLPYPKRGGGYLKRGIGVPPVTPLILPPVPCRIWPVDAVNKNFLVIFSVKR